MKSFIAIKRGNTISVVVKVFMSIISTNVHHDDVTKTDYKLAPFVAENHVYFAFRQLYDE